MAIGMREFSELTSLIYGAAIDETKWDIFLDRLSQTSGGVSTAISGCDYETNTNLGARVSGFDPDFMRDYHDYYYARNAWAEGLMASTRRHEQQYAPPKADICTGSNGSRTICKLRQAAPRSPPGPAETRLLKFSAGFPCNDFLSHPRRQQTTSIQVVGYHLHQQVKRLLIPASGGDGLRHAGRHVLGYPARPDVLVLSQEFHSRLVGLRVQGDDVPPKDAKIRAGDDDTGDDDTGDDDTDPGVDTDLDGIPDAEDNCAPVANAAQSDADGDGFGCYFLICAQKLIHIS